MANIGKTVRVFEVLPETETAPVKTEMVSEVVPVSEVVDIQSNAPVQKLVGV